MSQQETREGVRYLRHDDTCHHPSYKGFRFPQAIISHAVWLYFRLNLSYRDVEELLAKRGIAVTYEAIWQWVRKLGFFA